MDFFKKGDFIMRYDTVLKGSFLLGTLIFASSAFAQTDDTMPAQTTTTTSDVRMTDNDRAVTPQDDANINRTLTQLIKGSPVLSKLPVTVITKQGVIYIKGNVNSDTEASELVERAESIVGVSDVDTSKLNVKDSQQPLTDTYITAKVKGLFIREKLFGDKDISAINISVETKNGIVYLSGHVDNNDQIKNAIAIIKKSVPDVKGVEYMVGKTSMPADTTTNTDNAVTE
jgi:hyperosmotically inducible protein